MSEPVGVHIDCPCPGTPHADGDTVYLRPTLGLAAGIAVQKLWRDAFNAEDRLSVADLTGILAEGYLLYGVSSWTLVDDKSAPLEVTRQSIQEQLLDKFAAGAAVADAADDLYLSAVILPLVTKVANSSPGSQTNKSTSARNGHISKRPKRSKRSSTTTTQTDATEVTLVSLAGGSRP